MINQEEVKQGIDAQAALLVREIFSAFQNVYPNAHDVCKRCLPELRHVFSQGDLQRVFRRHGKAAMGTDDYFEFRTLLIEIGAVGCGAGED